MKSYKHRSNDEIPLPQGWQMCRDFDGKIFFVDHNTQETSWIDPRDRLTKPSNFAECCGDELPYGWEQVFDTQIGVYFTNHVLQLNQLEDPRQQHLRFQQEFMLKEYLEHAHQDVVNKKEICSVKQERLAIARDEVQHLNNSLSNWRTSRSNLQAASPAATSKYDPDLLKSEVDLSKKRVQRLKQEIAEIKSQMKYKEMGVETLSQVEQKLVGDQTDGIVYSVEDAQNIVHKIRDNYKNLTIAEVERRQLLNELARLKEEVFDTGQRNSADFSPGVSSINLSRGHLGTATSASQIDTAAQPQGNKWAEVARMRLKYNEAIQQVTSLQQQLADVEDQISPAQNESDKDRLILIAEKEQLLRELRSVSGRSEQEMTSVRARIEQLQRDIQDAVNVQNRQITERIKLNETKSDVLSKLEKATQLTSHLETQLKSLSVTSLSLSSSSSRGSLASLTSSKGSLSSLTFADGYNQSLPEVDLPDLHRRVEKLLQNASGVSVHGGSNQYLATIAENPQMQIPPSPESSHSSLVASGSDVTPPPPPTYEQHVDKQRAATRFSRSQPNVYQTTLPPNNSNPLSVSHPNLPHTDPVYVTNEPYENVYANLPGNVSVVDNVAAGANYQIVTSSADTDRTQVLPTTYPEVRPYPITRNQNAVVTPANSAVLPRPGPSLSPLSKSSSAHSAVVAAAVARSVSGGASNESLAGDSGVFEASAKRTEEIDGALDTNLECAQIQVKLRYEHDDGALVVTIEQARNFAALQPPEQCQICIKATILPSNQQASFKTSPSRNMRNPQFRATFRAGMAKNKLASKTLQLHVWSQLQSGREDLLGSAQLSLASFDWKTVSTEWYNVLSFRFMQADPTEHTPEDRKQSNPSTAGDRRRAATTGELDVISVEESSDESTIISSQTSTLTRNQGPAYCYDDDDDNDDVSADEDEADEKVQFQFGGGDNDSEHSFSPEGTVRRLPIRHRSASPSAILTTEARSTSSPLSSAAAVKGQIRRSQTFTPHVFKAADDSLRNTLNRSDSDSSVRMRKPAFQRNARERRSVKRRKSLLGLPWNAALAATSAVGDPNTARTSIDLELDLQASQARLRQTGDDVERLKLIKQKIEKAKQDGATLPLKSLSDNELLQQYLSQLANSPKRQEAGLDPAAAARSATDHRAQHLLRKAKREALKLRKAQHTDQQTLFKEKIAQITNLSARVPVISFNDSDSDTEQSSTLSHQQGRVPKSTSTKPKTS